MIRKVGAAVLFASMSVLVGVADGNAGKSSPSISGTWKADGTVAVARHIQGVQAGDHFSKQWTIKTSCSGTCETLSYPTSHGHVVSVDLHGHGKRWAGSLTNQTFECTNGGTATGSISFKLNVTRVVKHNKKRVADAMKGTGTQKGKGCTTLKEVVNFKVSRIGF